MRNSIGLPATIPDVSGALVLDWARRADAGPFASLGIIDRLVYPNFESLVTLAAVASVTQRVRLMTTVLLAPLRPAALLAKQAATLDALSEGRLTLGVGVGGREDDYLAAGAPFHERGRIFEAQLETMRRIWSGQPLADGVGAIGPRPAQPGGPELLIGAYAPDAVRRVARWADGFISGGLDAASAQHLYAIAEEAWRTAGRAGRPRFVGAVYYGLGPDAAARAAVYHRHYYSYMGPAGEQLAASIPSTPEAVKRTIQAFADAGADELMFWPCIPELEQVDRLAELVG